MNGENEAFFQKYSDALYLLGVLVSAVFSFTYSYCSRPEEQERTSYREMRALFDEVAPLWQAGLSEAEALRHNKPADEPDPLATRDAE